MAASPNSDDLRKQKEAEFYNLRELDRLKLGEEEFLDKYPNKKIYAIGRGPEAYLDAWLAQPCPVGR